MTDWRIYTLAGLLTFAFALSTVAVDKPAGYPEYTIQTHKTITYHKDGRTESSASTAAQRADGSQATQTSDMQDQSGKVIKPGGRYYSDQSKGTYVIEVPQVQSKMTFAAKKLPAYRENPMSCEQRLSPHFSLVSQSELQGLKTLSLRATRQFDGVTIETTLIVSPRHDCLTVSSREFHKDSSGELLLTIAEDLVSVSPKASAELFRDNPAFQERSPAEIDEAFTWKTGVKCSECQANTIQFLEEKYKSRAALR